MLKSRGVRNAVILMSDNKTLQTNINALEDSITSMIDTFETDNNIQLANLGYWKEENDGVSSNHVQASVVIQPQIVIQGRSQMLKAEARELRETEKLK